MNERSLDRAAHGPPNSDGVPDWAGGDASGWSAAGEGDDATVAGTGAAAASAPGANSARGAARGVVQPFLAAGIEQIMIVNRTADRAHELVRDLGARLPAADAARLSAGGFDAIAGGFDILINATSAGLADASPPVPAAAWSGVRLALDMVYAAQPTAFMRAAADAGCPCIEDGLGMLVAQAAESFALWRGVRPATLPVYTMLREQRAAARPSA